MPGTCASNRRYAPDALRGRAIIRGGNGELRSWQTTPELRISDHYLIHEQIVRLLCETPWTSSARTSGEDSQANNEPSQCECETQSVLSGVAADFCRHDPPGHVVEYRSTQCIEWLCPAMVMRESAASASRHALTTANAAKTGEGRRL